VFFLEKAPFACPTFVPDTMHNRNNHIISLGSLVRWLGQQAEALGVEIYPGFAAPTSSSTPRTSCAAWYQRRAWRATATRTATAGMELRGKYTFFAEGCLSQLGKRLLENCASWRDADPQHYAIGLKELWQVEPATAPAGRWWCTAPAGARQRQSGWLLLYHLEDEVASADRGLVVPQPVSVAVRRVPALGTARLCAPPQKRQARGLRRAPHRAGSIRCRRWCSRAAC
jgi:electron-transferring-flavoprotein dehydrogenase